MPSGWARRGGRPRPDQAGAVAGVGSPGWGRRGGVGRVQLQPRPHVEHVGLAPGLQGLAQGRRVAGGRVPAHPIRAHQALAQHVLDERRRHFRLAPVGLGGRWHPRPGATGGIAAPRRGQVQVAAHQAGRGAAAEHSKHADLPVADLAHLPDILTAHAHAHALAARLLPAARIH